eukprot:4810653-Amphidinium_carterae.1
MGGSSLGLIFEGSQALDSRRASLGVCQCATVYIIGCVGLGEQMFEHPACLGCALFGRCTVGTGRG